MCVCVSELWCWGLRTAAHLQASEIQMSQEFFITHAPSTNVYEHGDVQVSPWIRRFYERLEHRQNEAPSAARFSVRLQMYAAYSCMVRFPVPCWRRSAKGTVPSRDVQG